MGILLLLWLVLAQSCMKMRISDSKAKEKFAEQGVALQTATLHINGFPLHYAQTGSDTLPTLLFVHGTPGSWDAFAAYLRNKELLQHYRIISVDRPGFGYSDFGHAMNMTEQTKIISAWMDSVYNGKPFVLIGHSMGGPMIVKLAAARPSYTKALLILAGSMDPAAEKPEKWRPVLFKTPLNYLVPGAMRPSNEELWYLKTDLKEMQPDYEKITCPVYILHGTKDILVPYSNVGYMQKMFTQTDSVYVGTFEKENHFIVWTKEKEIVALLMKMK
ncbi:alpha/beta fold hydrolase [Lacibacter cauensis]|uniref:alpha/beta fold hydrolase n=1 Tax=Lacibacter cauensis TaxID=510947 RepID=UPI0013156560|nr:alpha/beta hydrolase [Lacibacter cauensis]